MVPPVSSGEQMRRRVWVFTACGLGLLVLTVVVVTNPQSLGSAPIPTRAPRPAVGPILTPPPVRDVAPNLADNAKGWWLIHHPNGTVEELRAPFGTDADNLKQFLAPGDTIERLPSASGHPVVTQTPGAAEPGPASSGVINTPPPPGTIVFIPPLPPGMTPPRPGPDAARPTSIRPLFPGTPTR